MKKENNLITFRDIFGPELTYEEALAKIRCDVASYNTFLSFPEDERQAFLEYFCGNRSMYITYDNVFRKIFSPSEKQKRLADFISAILGIPIKSLREITREGTQLVDKGSLVIMDIVLETMDGSIIDVEMQKIGYLFPGERSDCYMADSIMRQYNRIKDELGAAFTYDQMKPSYLIIIMEQSPKVFSDAFPEYIHIKQHGFNTGIKLVSLDNVRYISLDTFNRVMQNKSISNDLEAWLTLLSSSKVEKIEELINYNPEFLDIYREIAAFRTAPSEVISMFSEALAQMDRNTERYMIDIMKAEIEDLKAVKTELDASIAEKNASIAEKDKIIQSLEKRIKELSGDGSK